MTIIIVLVTCYIRSSCKTIRFECGKLIVAVDDDDDGPCPPRAAFDLKKNKYSQAKPPTVSYDRHTKIKNVHFTSLRQTYVLPF